jgi:predicted nucleic acid-binding Zn ribbon protein
MGSRPDVPEKECAQPVYEYIAAMPTYIYETTDPAKPVRTFEVKQSVHDAPLRSDPETGEGARRVISAGYNLLIRGKSVGPSVGSVGSH